MTIDELQQRLYDEGCNPARYAIGTRGGASDAYCLTHDGRAWQIYYTERGQDQPPFFTAVSEPAAYAFFYDFITALRHDHCVGFFEHAAAAQALQDRLAQLGIASQQDAIRYNGPNDLRYRVFVTGPAIFLAKAELGDIPLCD